METAKVVIDGKEVLVEDISDVTWEGSRSIRGMDSATVWQVHLDNGDVLSVSRASLDDEAKELLLDVVFPG